MQVVLKSRQLPLYYNDISHLSQPEQTTLLEEFKRNQRRAGFDLSAGPLMTFSLFRTGQTAYKLVWSFHHILMDGWCLGIIYAELIRIYRTLGAENRGPGEPLSLNDGYEKDHCGGGA